MWFKCARCRRRASFRRFYLSIVRNLYQTRIAMSSRIALELLQLFKVRFAQGTLKCFACSQSCKDTREAIEECLVQTKKKSKAGLR